MQHLHSFGKYFTEAFHPQYGETTEGRKGRQFDETDRRCAYTVRLASLSTKFEETSKVNSGLPNMFYAIL